MKQRRDRERALHDIYHTPYCATRELLSRHGFKGDILEPACGSGYIYYALAAHGYDRLCAADVRTDMSLMLGANYGSDFFSYSRLVDNIVTNPPFCIAEEFIAHALEITVRKVALLLRLSFLASASRYPLWQVSPPSDVIVLSKRLPYQDPDGRWNLTGGQFDHAWFVWDHDDSNETRLSWARPDTSLIYPPGYMPSPSGYLINIAGSVA